LPALPSTGAVPFTPNQYTHKAPLDRINEAFDLMHEGTSNRTVIEV